MIDEFRGQYYFLSNFYQTSVRYNGLVFNNSEAAFQAQKTLDNHEKEQFINLAAGKAKRLGKKVNLREDWESVKDEIMYEVVRAKFDQNNLIANQLLETGCEELVEGNNWGDHEWGVCGYSENKLGKILMKVREELK
jgi:ribA/ribD-fused uncharacterized protein